MMYEPEKSDLFIVATKRANKRGRPRAESVERRERAEGSTSEQRTRRTLSRASVSQRLARVREGARHGRKERFTALMHHLTLEVLAAAFGWLKRTAAAGIDNVTWQDYAQHREANLVDLHARLYRRAYRAMPSRRQ